RAFYAQKDTRTPVKAAVASFLVNVVLSVALMGPLSTLGLALASNLAVVVQAVILQVSLSRKRPELQFGPLWGDLARIVLASVVMAVTVETGERLVGGGQAGLLID